MSAASSFGCFNHLSFQVYSFMLLWVGEAELTRGTLGGWKAGSVVGMELEGITSTSEKRTLMLKILDNDCHPLHNTFNKQKNIYSNRLLSLACTTDRLKKSFVPRVITVSAFTCSQLSRITAIVRLYYSIRQLQLSKYTCWGENQIIGWSISYPSTIGGAILISTSGNRATSGWPLYVTSNNKLPRHSRKMAHEEQDEATYLYISYMVYMIITLTGHTMALLLAMILEERRCSQRPSTSGSRPRERNLAPVQNAKSDPIW